MVLCYSTFTIMNSQDYKIALESLASKALKDIDTLESPIIQFCGPISTGGLGVENMLIDEIKSFYNSLKL